MFTASSSLAMSVPDGKQAPVESRIATASPRTIRGRPNIFDTWHTVARETMAPPSRNSCCVPGSYGSPAQAAELVMAGRVHFVCRLSQRELSRGTPSRCHGAGCRHRGRNPGDGGDVRAPSRSGSSRHGSDPIAADSRLCRQWRMGTGRPCPQRTRCGAGCVDRHPGRVPPSGSLTDIFSY